MRTLHHHTKTKGDQGLGFTIAALIAAGVQVALPLSEHLPFDLIAITETGKLSRVSVKYKTAKNGVIAVDLRSGWSNSKGVHKRALATDDIDVVAVYCPDTGVVYFFKAGELRGTSLQVRLKAPERAYDFVRMASDFLDPLRVFSSTAP